MRPGDLQGFLKELVKVCSDLGLKVPSQPVEILQGNGQGVADILQSLASKGATLVLSVLADEKAQDLYADIKRVGR